MKSRFEERECYVGATQVLRRRYDDFYCCIDVGEGGAEGSGRKLEAGVDGTGVEEMPDNSRSLLIIAYYSRSSSLLFTNKSLHFIFM